MSKKLRVSLVIPVYNEESHLAECLAAALSQDDPFYEVIVVDNNSDDSSVAVAEQFLGVRIVREGRQGVVFARSAGYDVARGDIIARIDADTLLPTDWTHQLQAIFKDQRLDAVSGAVSYHDLPWRRFLAGLDVRFRQWIADGMGDEVFLFGSNMALRKSAWRRVRRQVCFASGLHEDFDLAIHLYEADCQTTFDRRLQAAVSLRRFDVSLLAYWQYVWLSPKTYSLHGRTSHGRMYPVVGLVVSGYWLIRLLYRSYDAPAQRLSWRQAWLPRASARVNPATFVD